MEGVDAAISTLWNLSDLYPLCQLSGTCPAGSGAPPGPSAPESTTSSASTSTSSAGTTGLTPQAKSDAEMLILAALALSLIGSIGYAIAGRKKRPVNDHRGFE